MNRNYNAFLDGPLERPRLEYLGHASFALTTPGRIKIIIDPFQNPRGRPKWFERRFPGIQSNIVAASHDHFDHNATKQVKGLPAVLKRLSSIKVSDMEVQLVPDQHAQALHRKPGAGSEMMNHIVVVESHGLRLCHLGDNRPDISADAVKAIGRVDVLFVPVDDSEHLLTFGEVESVIDLLDPRIVIPMHYFQRGLTAESSGLEGIEGWLGTQSAMKVLDSSAVTFEDGSLPDQREVWVMEPSLAKTAAR